MDDIFPSLSHRSSDDHTYQPAHPPLQTSLSETLSTSAQREAQGHEASFRYRSEHQPSVTSGYFRHRPGSESAQASLTSAANESDARSYRSHSFSDNMSVHDVIEAYTDKLATKLNPQHPMPSNYTAPAPYAHGSVYPECNRSPPPQAAATAQPLWNKTTWLTVLIVVVVVLAVVYQLHNWTDHRTIHPQLTTNMQLFYRMGANRGQSVD